MVTRTKKLQSKTDGIILIICPCYNCWGANHCLPLFRMAKSFIWLNETKQRINELTTGYMINTNLNINKAFREKVDKCMKNKFDAITQNFIIFTLLKNKTVVLALLMFYETKAENIAL